MDPHLRLTIIHNGYRPCKLKVVEEIRITRRNVGNLESSVTRSLPTNNSVKLTLCKRRRRRNGFIYQIRLE
jgi:hypothetical protein